jgi:hypothetical protein
MACTETLISGQQVVHSQHSQALDKGCRKESLTNGHPIDSFLELMANQVLDSDGRWRSCQQQSNPAHRHH